MGKLKSRGVGAVLTINGETKKMQEFLGEFPTRVAAPKDSADLHLTLLDFEETMIPVTSVRDRKALSNTLDGIKEYLEFLPLGEINLKSSAPGLKKYGRYAGIAVIYDEFLQEARNQILGIAAGNLGAVALRSAEKGEYEPHISVAKLRNVKRPLNLYDYEPTIPNLHVTGYSLGMRVKGGNMRRNTKKQNYANRPKALRRQHH